MKIYGICRWVEVHASIEATHINLLERQLLVVYCQNAHTHHENGSNFLVENTEVAAQQGREAFRPLKLYSWVQRETLTSNKLDWKQAVQRE